MRAAVSTPIVDWIGETVRCATQGGALIFGVMATDGTLAVGLYERALAERGARQIVPPSEMQKELMEAIYSVKVLGASEAATDVFNRAARSLSAGGAEVIVLGCTEISSVHESVPVSCPVPVIDGLDTVARLVVQRATSPRS